MDFSSKFDSMMETLAKGVIPFVFFIGFCFFGYLQLPSFEEPTSEYGKVVGLRGAEGDGVRLYLDVELDSGKNVLVKIPNTGAYYKKGKRIRLDKRKSNILSLNEYTFGQYVSK